MIEEYLQPVVFLYIFVQIIKWLCAKYKLSHFPSYEPFEGRNPKTGEKTDVKAKKLPFIKVGLELRKAVDDGSKK